MHACTHTHLSPIIVMIVLVTVLHWAGNTLEMVAGCTRDSASYVAVAEPAAVLTTTAPLPALVTHSSCECA